MPSSTPSTPTFTVSSSVKSGGYRLGAPFGTTSTSSVARTVTSYAARSTMNAAWDLSELSAIDTTAVEGGRSGG